jgi:hypothetical protein
VPPPQVEEEEEEEEEEGGGGGEEGGGGPLSRSPLLESLAEMPPTTRALLHNLFPNVLTM